MTSHGVDRGRLMAFRPHRRLGAGRLRVAQVSGLAGGRGVAEGKKDTARRSGSPGQSGEARIFLIQDDNLTAEVPLRRSILQSTLRQKYRSTGRHNPQRDGGPEKG